MLEILLVKSSPAQHKSSSCAWLSASSEMISRVVTSHMEVDWTFTRSIEMKSTHLLVT
jgi:hypothetical protein